MKRGSKKEMQKIEVKIDSKCRMKYRPFHRRTNV